jgi:plastocyanin
MRAISLVRAAAGLTFLGLTAISAACGGSDSGSSTTGTQAASNNPAVPAGAPYIDQDHLAFKPSKLTVKAGEKVYFTNNESALHTVTVNGKNESGTMKRNDVYVWTAPAPGSYKITCDLHPQMNATVTVR